MMEVEYQEYRWGKTHDEVESVESYVCDKILYKDSYNRDKVKLEDQPEVVAKALGRLVERLMEKNILNLDDMHYIADTMWDSGKVKIKVENPS